MGFVVGSIINYPKYSKFAVISNDADQLV